MNSGFRTAKMGKPQARDSHFSYKFFQFLQNRLFSRLNSVQRATLVQHIRKHQSFIDFFISFFQLFDSGFCFFSSFSSFRLRACSSFCCCQESLLSELSVSGALVSAGSDGAGAYFSVSSSFSPDNNRSHQYNSQSPDGSGQEIACSGLINKITVMRNIEDGSAVAV